MLNMFIFFLNLHTLVLLDHVYSDCLQNVATNTKNKPFSGFGPWPRRKVNSHSEPGSRDTSIPIPRLKPLDIHFDARFYFLTMILNQNVEVKLGNK